jgi:uncharacterized protein
MDIFHIESAAVAAEPWKNGGGRTRPLFAWPSAQDWAFRISLAEVERSGPFSSFPGIDRQIAIVRGGAVTLRFDGATPPVALGPVPFHFDGALAPACEVPGEAATDLNLMIDRARGQGTLALADSHEWTSADEWRGAFSADAAQLAIGKDRTVSLKPMSLLLTRGLQGTAWTLEPARPVPRLWWIGVTMAPSPFERRLHQPAGPALRHCGRA